MLINLPNPSWSFFGKYVVRVILAVALLSSTSMAQEGSTQTQALKSIQQAGGRVMQIAADSPDLEISFHLTDAPVTDDVLKHLPGAGPVIWLNLRGTKISDAGLQHIGKLKNLKKLHLELTSVSDAGLAQLVKLDQLEYLNLYGTSVSDAGLEDIAKLQSLQKVFLWRSKASDAGMEKLRAARPELQVIGGAKLPLLESKPAADKQATKPGEQNKDKK